MGRGGDNPYFHEACYGSYLKERKGGNEIYERQEMGSLYFYEVYCYVKHSVSSKREIRGRRWKEMIIK